jgi:hypothetical protein
MVVNITPVTTTGMMHASMPRRWSNVQARRYSLPSA